MATDPPSFGAGSLKNGAGADSTENEIGSGASSFENGGTIDSPAAANRLCEARKKPGRKNRDTIDGYERRDTISAKL